MPQSLQYYWKKKTVVSFLLSIFVIIIHNPSFTYYSGADGLSPIFDALNIFIHSSFVAVAVPLFFIISGATYFRNYDNRDYKKKLVSRLKTLGIPYLCWNFLNMLFDIAVSYTFISNYFTGREKFIVNVPNVLRALFLYECNGPFWFIFCLLVFVIASPVINALISNKVTGAIVLGIMCVLELFEIGLPQAIFFSRSALLFYLAGAYAGKHFFDWFSGKASKKTAFCASLLSVVFIIFYFIKYYKFSNAGFPQGVENISLVLFCFVFWKACDTVTDKVETKWFMNCSFLIYAMHVNIQTLISKLIYIALPKYDFMTVINFVIALPLTVILICIVYYLLKRFTPKLYTILCGER